MGALQYLEILAGVAVLLVIMHDLFQSVVLPRPSVYRVPLASQLLVRQFWRIWRWAGHLRKNADKREHLLGTFGPAALLMALGFWSLSLIAGYSLIFDALGEQIQPHPNGFWTSVFYSAGTLLPLSYGDYVPVGGAARVATIAESGTGVILIALVISLLFSLYQSFQAREELVVSLDALAGAPPSAIQLLETAATERMPERLGVTFDEWRKWSASVLESHLAYPILFYFRSSHDNEAWLNSFGAVMDAATLVLSTIEHDSEGAARMMWKVGNHLVEDTQWYFRIPPDNVVGLERREFDVAWSRLRDAGYRCRDPQAAWEEFSNLRRGYASTFDHMVRWFAVIPAPWAGERTYLPHSASAQRPLRPAQDVSPKKS